MIGRQTIFWRGALAEKTQWKIIFQLTLSATITDGITAQKNSNGFLNLVFGYELRSRKERQSGKRLAKSSANMNVNALDAVSYQVPGERSTMPTPNDPCHTYWIKDATCNDPFAHGYVGLTSNLKSRSRYHLRSGRFPVGVTISILNQGTRTECAAVEKLYRPHANIG